MAVRSVSLGGSSDWTDGEAPSAEDLNDTIDAAVSKIQTLSAFWLNSDLYDVYDDFESYSTGAFTTNAKWTVSSGSASVVASTNAGGTSQELLINATSSNATSAVVTSAISTNKHSWFRVAINFKKEGANDKTVNGRLDIKIGSQSYTRVADFSSSRFGDGDDGFITTNVLVVAKGSDVYDLYVGGDKIFSDVTEATPEIGIQAVTGVNSTAYIDTKVYIDDVRQSKSEIS